ncbi:MAG: acyl carrier protein [Bacteroidia bacterium]
MRTFEIMTVNDFIEKIEDAIEDLPKGYLKPETEYRKSEIWSSMHSLIIIALVDTEYDVVITGEDLRNCRDVNALFDLIKSRRK